LLDSTDPASEHGVLVTQRFSLDNEASASFKRVYSITHKPRELDDTEETDLVKKTGDILATSKIDHLKNKFQIL